MHGTSFDRNRNKKRAVESEDKSYIVFFGRCVGGWFPCLALQCVNVFVHKFARVSARLDLAPSSW